tara:strand:+ start:1123 stop:1452 length:330 start_codon:yes stop_codon:yes gene_type:complete
MIQDAEHMYSDVFNVFVNMTIKENSNQEYEMSESSEYMKEESAYHETNEMNIAEDDDTETCAVCNEPGYLIVCDACEKCYHLFCACLSKNPTGNFYCLECKNLQQQPSD